MIPPHATTPLHRPGRERIGLVAGWGRYPIVVAESLKQQGHTVYCLGIKGHVDPRLIEICDDFRYIGLGRLGAAIRYFRRNHVRQATMAGKIHKVRLFQPGMLWQHFPDWRGVVTFYPHWITNSKDRKDDTLLGAIVNAYAQDGIEFAPATDFAPELLVGAGQLTRGRLTSAQEKDIRFGWQLAKELGRLDIGQSVAVKGQAALAVEAIEGTDACIRRAGELCTVGGFTVVKVAKPQQDMRFDVPTIGIGTLETMVAARAKVLAIEAHRTILLDRAEVIRFAERHKIIIVSIDPAALAAAPPPIAQAS